MSTKLKIIAGFIVMIALVAGMAALGYYELQKTSDGFTEYSRNARVNVATSDLEARLYLSTAKTYDYVISGDSAKMDEALKLSDAFAALALEAEKETGYQERKDAFQSMQKQIGVFKNEQAHVRASTEALQKQFLERVRPNYVLMMEKVGELARSARSVDNTQLLYSIHEVWHDFSLALAFIGRFAQSGMPEEGKMALDRINALATPLTVMGGIIQTTQGRQIYGELTTAYKTLKDAANAMAANAGEMVVSLSDMHRIEADVSGAIATLNRQVDTGMRELGSRVLDDNNQAQSLLLALSAAGLLAGAAMAASSLSASSACSMIFPPLPGPWQTETSPTKPGPGKRAKSARSSMP